MQLQKLKTALFLSLLMPLSVWAIPVEISAGYSIEANGSDPGLVVQVAEYADNPFSFSLEEGEAERFKLFHIWTNESHVNGDDRVPQAISANFSFALPDTISGEVSGETKGSRAAFGLIHYGELSWGDPAEVFFGPNLDGLITIELSDAVYNEGPFGLNDGAFGIWDSEDFKEGVWANITLVRNATEVPEPGSLALLGLGLVGLGMTRRHKRKISV